MSNRRPAARAKRKGDAIDPRYMVPGLSRGLKALALFTRRTPTLSLVEIARGLKLSRSAAYRLIYTLDKDGFVLRDEETRKYRLTSKTLSLGFEYLQSQTITEVAQPYLRNLSGRTFAVAYLAILDGWHAVYLARALPAVGLVSNLQVGMRLPAHLTASGRVMLAFHDDAWLGDIFQRLKREGRDVQCPAWQDLCAQARADRQRGYVFHRSLVDPGLVSLACPIRDHDSTTVAAITVIVPEKLCDGFGGEKALRPLVTDAAAEISGRLGYRG